MSKKAFIHNDGVFFCIPHRDNEMPGCDMQNLVYQWDLPFFFFFFKWWVYILFTRLPTCTLLMSLLGYIDYIDSYGCYNSFFFGIVFVFFLHSVGPYNFFFRDVYKFFIWAESFDTWMPRERSGSVIFFPGYWETF